MSDTTHLTALHRNLANERARFAVATGAEREMRAVWVAQLEKEVAGELAFLGLSSDPITMSDDELLMELAA